MILEAGIPLRLTDKLPNHNPLLVVEFKPDDPNLLNWIGKVKPYVDAVRLTALKNSADPIDPSNTAERICLQSAIKVTHRSNVDVIASLVCRDHPRNDAQILRDLKQSGVDNVLALYGEPNDPPYPNHYQFRTSSELIRWLRKEELQGGAEKFCIAVGSDPTSKDVEKQISTMKEKREAGADIAISQPIFEPQQALESLEALDGAEEKLPLLIGLLVPKSEKTFTFLERRLGIRVPVIIKDRMKGKGVEEGLQIVREAYRALLSKAAGFYLYPWADPDLRVVTILLEELRKQN